MLRMLRMRRRGLASHSRSRSPRACRLCLAGPRECTPLLQLLSDEARSIVRGASGAGEEEEELAVAAAQALGALLDAAEPLPTPLLESLLLPTCLAALEGAQLTAVEHSAASAEWLHTLLRLLRTRRLPVDTLDDAVLPFALSRGDSSSHVASSHAASSAIKCNQVQSASSHVASSHVGQRLLCTHLLGALAEAHPEPSAASGWVQVRMRARGSGWRPPALPAACQPSSARRDVYKAMADGLPMAS